MNAPTNITPEMSDNGNLGVTPSGSGCQPTASAADASSQSGIPNAGRPRQNDPDILRIAAEELAEDCANWCGQSEPHEWVDDLLQCLRCYRDDGYELARELESVALVSPDAELVEILDSASDSVWRAHKAATKAWVEKVGFTPLFAKGDIVSCRHGTGPIHDIMHDTAEYVVDTERRGNGGFVIAAENVTPAEQVSA